jgi:transcriptional regulator with XRE-family HTH domain
VRSGDLIRDARLRAGISQGDLGARVDRDRVQISRWERNVVAPSLETLQELVRACGYDFSLKLEAFTPEGDDDVLRETLLLTPDARLRRMLDALESES